MILSTILLLPLAGLAALLCLPSSRTRAIAFFANAVMLAGLAACVPAWLSFEPRPGFQMVERATWIPTLRASYHLGVDGYSLLLVTMTALLGCVAMMSSWRSIEQRSKEYYAWSLLLQFAMQGVFLSLDGLLFFVFWELTLIPMYFLIAIWGGERRSYAATKFLIYTLAGSVVMFLGLLAVSYRAGTFDITQWSNIGLPPADQRWIFWALFAGFAVKVPMFPFHTWLPDAHTEAPTAGSVILAGVMLKMGTYGFLRFSLPVLPEASRDPAIVNIVAALSIIAIVYGALVCLMQPDWKKLVAYSSVSHMGFCTLGIFALNPDGLAGSMLQQLNHSISTSMLFLIVGFAYERRHTRAIADFGGLYQTMPSLTAIYLITVMSSMGLPPLNGFIGEFTILKGAYQMSVNWVFWCAAGIVLGAVYLLWLFQRTALGDPRQGPTGPDLSGRELAICAPLIALMFWIGLYPKPFFAVLRDSVR